MGFYRFFRNFGNWKLITVIRNSHIIRHTLRHYLAAGYCRDVHYHYGSGVNCVYLNFEKA